MPVKVVDASALAAMLFGESQAGEVANRIRGFSLACPALLPFEIANVCLNKGSNKGRVEDRLDYL